MNPIDFLQGRRDIQVHGALMRLARALIAIYRREFGKAAMHLRGVAESIELAAEAQERIDAAAGMGDRDRPEAA